MHLFNNKHGIIPACDVPDLDSLLNLVTQTCSLDFIQGYKLGMEIMLHYGARAVLEEVRKLTDLPVIYDHQKYGNDIPDVSAGNTLDILKQAGIDSLIIFPFAGIETLKKTIDGCHRTGIFPIVGGEMTHKGFLASEGGYLSDTAPQKIYEDAAHLGIDTFVVPGTKIDKIRKYVSIVRKIIQNPKFVFPGIGKGQGGDISEAFKAALPCDSYAIVGRGIYAASEISDAALKLWKTGSTVLT